LYGDPFDHMPHDASAGASQIDDFAHRGRESGPDTGFVKYNIAQIYGWHTHNVRTSPDLNRVVIQWHPEADRRMGSGGMNAERLSWGSRIFFLLIGVAVGAADFAGFYVMVTTHSWQPGQTILNCIFLFASLCVIWAAITGNPRPWRRSQL
jgi:hypothetical protein